MKSHVLVIAAFSLVIGSCGGGGSDAADARPTSDGNSVATAIAHYAPPATAGAGAAFGDVPYPSDLYLDADGYLTFTSLPTGPGAQQDFVDIVIEALHSMDGAGIWSFAYVPIDGAIDPTTLEGNVAIVRLPDLAPVPVDLVWRDDLSAILAVPAIGTALEEDTSYAVYVTTGVKAPDGSALARAAAFEAEMASPSQLAPLFAVLDDATEATLAVATVFRTETVTAETKAMRDVIASRSPAAFDPQVVQTFFGASQLDGLFGAAADDAVPGTLHPGSGFRGQPHGNVAIVMHGTIVLPRFVSDTPGVDGFATFGADGVPVVKGTDTVRFTLALPTSNSWANLPVALYVPGVNRTRGDMLPLVDAATDRGIAMIAIDMPYHGNRASSPTDTKNETTGENVPDGIGDDKGLTPAVQLFHLNNSGGIPAYHPQAMRENLRQAAMDICSLVEFVADGNAATIQAAATAASASLPDDLSFRGDMVLVTESLGALVSGPCVAVEPRIGAVTLSSPASGFPFPSMMHSPNYSGLFLGAVVNPFGIADRVVLGDPTRGARFEPVIMLYNGVLEKGETSGHARAIATGALRGDSGPHININMAWADEWVSNDTTEHLAGVLGLHRLVTSAPTAPPGGALRFVSLPESSATLQGNLTGERTGALTVYHPAAHASLRKLTDANTYEPDFPPFVELPAAVPLNPTPIAEMHAQWGRFFADYFAGTTPRVIDPYAAP